MPQPAHKFNYLDSVFKKASKTTKKVDDVDVMFSNAEQEVRGEMSAVENLFKSNEGGLGFPASSEAPKTYEPTVLNARHREILRLTALGYKQTQVAAILGITPATVGYVVRSPLGEDFLANIEEARTDSVKDVHNRLKEISPLASEVLLDILIDGKENNKLRAAEGILKMAGQGAENRHLHLHTHMTQDDIQKVKERARGGPEVVSEDALDPKKELK